ncbi:MAG: nucleoside-diphosphate kinase [Patescibacteria group bacterium]|nr:nucleoside-diphosphate kinase [Patescibacteria group bacterium]
MKNEKTLIVIKPDGVQRSLVGEIIKRFERIGLKLTAVKMIVPTADFIECHYTVDPEWKRVTGEKTIESYRKKGLTPPIEDPFKVTERVLKNLQNFMTSGPVIAMVWQGLHAVKLSRKIVGGTEPFSSDVGTIRGDFVLDSYQTSDKDGRSIRNLIHASGSIEDAKKEIALWFKPDEIINYKLVSEQILYDVNLDGILE